MTGWDFFMTVAIVWEVMFLIILGFYQNAPEGEDGW